MSLLKSAIAKNAGRNLAEAELPVASVQHQHVVFHARVLTEDEVAEAAPLQAQEPQLALEELRQRFEVSVKQQSRYGSEEELQQRWPMWQAGGRKHGSSRGRPAGQGAWHPEVEADLKAVAAEAGLPASFASCMVDAAKKGQISSNPGILLSQVLRMVAVLDSFLGRRSALQVLQAAPALLNTGAQTVGYHFEELAANFGQEQARSMVSRAPTLLATPPFSVWSNLLQLSTMLDVGLERAQAVAARQPRLLALALSTLAARMDELEEALELPMDQLQRLVLAQPALLTYAPATLASNLAAMALCLGAGRGQVSRMVARAPGVLMLAPETLASKVVALGELLGSSTQEAALVVLRQPSILSISTDLLSAKCEELAQVLGTPPAEAIALAASNPALLTLSIGTVRRKLDALGAAVEAAAAAEAEAGAVAASAAAQQVQAGEGGEGCSSSDQQHQQGGSLAAAWQEQLHSAAPRMRAALACFSEQRHARLAELAAAHAAAAAGVTPGAVEGSQGPATAAAAVIGESLQGSCTSGADEEASLCEEGEEEEEEQAEEAAQGPLLRLTAPVSLSQLLRMNDAKYRRVLATVRQMGGWGSSKSGTSKGGRKQAKA